MKKDGFSTPIPAQKTNIDEVLLLASFPRTENSKAAVDITGGFGWRAFLAAADRESLSQLIYYNHRQSIKEGLIPPDAATHLKKKYFATLARNMVFLQKLEEVSAALAGTDFIVLKGAYLASRIYASPGLRQFSDIDILIRRMDMPTVQERLRQLGYECAGPVEHSGKIPAESAFLNSVIYNTSETGPSLHVHWHLLNSILPIYTNATMDVSEIWKATRQTTGTARELCPEHLLIYLSEHALRHSFDRLILLRDIAEVIMKLGQEIDWERLVHDSIKFNLNQAIYDSLVFVGSKTGVSIPDSVIAGLRCKRPGLCGRIFMSLAASGRRSTELCNLAYLDNIASVRGKIAFVWQIFFPPRDVLAHAYGRKQCEIGLAVYALRILRGMRHALRQFKLKIRHTG